MAREQNKTHCQNQEVGQAVHFVLLSCDLHGTENSRVNWQLKKPQPLPNEWQKWQSINLYDDHELFASPNIRAFGTWGVSVSEILFIKDKYQ